MAAATLALQPGVGSIDPVLLDRHYQRKHGEDATYGQGSGRKPDGTPTTNGKKKPT